MRQAAQLLTLLLLGVALAVAEVTYAPEVGGGWRRGRATFFGGDPSFLSNFPDRGPPPEYGFGTTNFGSCAYYEQSGNAGVTYANQAYPRDAIAALANNDPDYPGSCGRCYEIRCHTGPVVANGTAPYKVSNTYNLAAHAPAAKDDQGRTWPGNPLANNDTQAVQCWRDVDGSGGSIVVTITDMCPCVQRDDVRTPYKVTGVNPPCCGDVYHFDLSFWAFQHLAHPLYGIMMVDFRPVDCTTKAPLQFLPGFVNQTIYGNRVETGWSWEAYKQTYNAFWAPEAGIYGSNATCQAVPLGGGVTFACRECSAAGYQPFAKATALEFWIAGTPGSAPGVPPITVTVGNYEDKKFCSSYQTDQLKWVDKVGSYYKMSIPLAWFYCPAGYNQGNMDFVSFQNNQNYMVSYCLSQIMLVGTPTAPTAAALAQVGMPYTASDRFANFTAPAPAGAQPAVTAAALSSTAPTSAAKAAPLVAQGPTGAGATATAAGR